MAYQRQFVPAGHIVGKNRKNMMDPEYTLKKIRTLSDEDFLAVVGHRKIGESYKSVHPPISETGEPEDPMRELVSPTEGAKAGDRISTMIFSDSVYDSPLAVYSRAWAYHNRFRGVDCGCYSGRTTLEMRERDLEQATRVMMETEALDARRNTARQYTCTGHSTRLDPQGLMFDAMQRCAVDDNGDVIYHKDSFGNPLDKPVNFGKGKGEADLKEKSVIYRSEVDPMIAGSNDETLQYTRAVFLGRTMGNVDPANINK